jgi:hypothetical protein
VIKRRRRTRLGQFSGMFPEGDGAHLACQTIERAVRSGSAAVDPRVEADEIAVRVQHRELARSEVGGRDAVHGDGMEDVGRPQLRVQLVNAVDLDPAACRTGEEGLPPEQTGRSARSSRRRQLSSLDSQRWTIASSRESTAKPPS